MFTRKRYIISLEQEHASILERYATVVGMRPSAVIKSLMEQSMDQLQNSIGVLEHLSSAYKGAVDDSSARAAEGVAEALEELQEQGEQFMQSVRGAGNTLAINKGNKGVTRV